MLISLLLMLQPYRLYKYINNIIRTFFTTYFESYACALIAKYKANSFKKPSQDNNEAGRSMNFLLLSHYFFKIVQFIGSELYTHFPSL